MRNIFLAVAAVAFASAAWAADPLVGPGKVGEKDDQGQVKGANAGAGPHEHFQPQLERRVDPPQEQIAAEKKAQAKKAAEDKKAEQKAGAGATR
jgi:hypothetical protein